MEILREDVSLYLLRQVQVEGKQQAPTSRDPVIGLQSPGKIRLQVLLLLGFVRVCSGIAGTIVSIIGTNVNKSGIDQRLRSTS